MVDDLEAHTVLNYNILQDIIVLNGVNTLMEVVTIHRIAASNDTVM